MTRLAIVGIDGATFDIIRPMVAEGELPHIARILREGVSANLESETPPITPPAWTSMMTGVNPGRHGIIHFIRRRLGSYDCELNDSRSYAGKDLLSLLARRHWKVGALNVPMTFPPFALPGGYMVSGIPMPLEGEVLGAPEGTIADMERILGHRYRSDVDYAPYDGDTETARDDLDRYEPLREELFRIERDRLQVMREWLASRPTELFFTVVSVTDRAQHYFWKFQDESHAGFTPEGRARYGEVIRDAYRLADEFVGAVRDAVGDEAPIALVSDHGFGSHDADFHIHRWLEDEGYLVRRRTPYWTLRKPTVARLLQRVHLGGLARLLGPVGRWSLPLPYRKTRADASDVDWSRTRVWSALHGLCLNLAGREPEGIVKPEEADALLAEVERRLAALRTRPGEPDPVQEGGVPAVDYCGRARDLYDGPHTDAAPDLQFAMMGLACVPKDDWDSPHLFTWRRNAAISGQHRFAGIFALAGPAIAAGKVLPEMHIRDTTPTLLHAVDQPVPTWMEGKVWREIFAAPRGVEYDQEPEPAAAASSDQVFSPEQAAAIEESLKGLGYLQ